MINTRNKLLLSIILIVTTVGLIFGAVQSRISSEARQTVADTLTTVRDATHHSIKTWFKEHKAAATIWANAPPVRQAAEQLLKVSPEQAALISSPAQDNLRAWFNQLRAATRYQGYFLVGPANINLASSRDQNVGSENLLGSQHEFLTRVWNGETAVSLPLASDVPLPDEDNELRANLPTMFAAAPIIDDSDNVIAIFMFRLMPAEGFSSILQQGRIGNSGETYAFDQHARLLSQSRFDRELQSAGIVDPDKHAMLNIRILNPGVNIFDGQPGNIPADQQPLTRMASSATRGESGIDLDGYHDYRGVTVIGAWLWDHELGFGITTEIDADEAYHALRATRHAMLVLSTSIILLLIGLVTIYILYQERRKAEAALRERETLFRVLLEGVGADYLIYRVGFDRVLQYLTPAIERFTGVAMQTAVKMEWWELFNVTPETLHQIKQLDEKLQQGETNESHYDASYTHPDGTLRTLEASERPEFDVHGRRIAILGIIKDVTARNKTEQELRRAATVFDNTDEGIIVTDADRHITVINKAVTKITGYKQNEVLGKTPHFQKSGRHDQAFYESLWETIERDGKWRGEIWNRRRNGEIYPAWENITAVKDEHGHISNYVAVFSDISAIKESEERLAHLAHHDSLTGLPNRLRFIANLEQALESAKRHKHKVAVMFLDLDRFKLINDTLGHSFGDELLKSIAGRLKSTVRSEDTVARLGGDEFTIILHEIGRSEDSALIAEKVINTTRQPVCLGGEDISVSTSIGISIYPDDSDNSDGLVKAADAAMYHAKNSGRSNFQFYTFDLTSRALEHLALENGLRQALEKNEFVLHYQPQVEMCSERISGVEALIRWQHPERGLLMPTSFMKVANETGLIDPMSEWVLRTACSDLVQWRLRGLPPTRIAVNISGRQLMHEPSIRRIVTFLDEIDPQPGSLGLDLEVTEASIEFAERAMEIMRQLKERGVMLAIDDFGTGHSSLSRLKELPVDTLKIDRSFIQNIANDPDDRVIASTIIAMAHSLGLRVVAEGVEAEDQLSVLRALDCDEIQGFYYSKPIPAEQMVLLLEQQLTGA